MDTPQTQKCVCSHTIHGRVVGAYTSNAGAPRQIAVSMPLDGPELAPHATLIPLDSCVLLWCGTDRFQRSVSNRA